jgi:hypothetical protein
MKLVEIVGAAVRLFAFYLVYVAVSMAVNLVPIRLTASGYELDRLQSYWALSSLLNFVFCIALAVFLLARTAAVVSWVVRSTPQAEAATFSTDGLTLVAVMVAGLVFFVHGTRGLLEDGTTWLLAQKDPYTGSRPLLPIRPGAVVASAFETLFGLYLVVGQRGLVNVAKRLRGFKDEPASGGHPTPDA